MVAPKYGPGAARRAANSFFLPRFLSCACLRRVDEGRHHRRGICIVGPCSYPTYRHIRIRLAATSTEAPAFFQCESFTGGSVSGNNENGR